MSTLRITAADFEERPNGLFFLGDIAQGRSVVAADRYIFEGVMDFTDGRQAYVVSLRDGEAPETEAEWGSSSALDAEEAWRYALGAALGPYDYDEPYIDLTVPST